MTALLRVGLLLGLAAAAAAAIHLAPPLAEGPGRWALGDIPFAIAGWDGVEGAPEWALPLDPNEIGSVRRTYRHGGHTVWVSVALFGLKEQGVKRAAINSIHPDKHTSRIERLSAPVALNGRPGGVAVPLAVVHGTREPLVIAYWYQFGADVYGGEYSYRLALLRRTILARRGESVLVRIGVPASAGQSREKALGFIQEIGPVLHAAVSRAMNR